MTFSTFWMQVNWIVWHLWRCLLHVNINTISRWKVFCVMTAFLRNSNRIQHKNQPPFWGIFRSFEVVGVYVCCSQFSFNLSLKICMLTLIPDIEQSGHFSNMCLLYFGRETERKRQKKNCVQVEYICGSLFTRECTQCGSVARLEIDTKIETDSLLRSQRCVCLSFQWFKVVEWNILQYKLQENGIQP